MILMNMLLLVSLEAVDEGKISKERYEHYLTMLKELKEKKEKRYG